MGKVYLRRVGALEANPLIARNPSSLVIDNLCDSVKKENSTIASLYYSFLARQEQTIL